MVSTVLPGVEATMNVAGSVMGTFISVVIPIMFYNLDEESGDEEEITLPLPYFQPWGR